MGEATNREIKQHWSKQWMFSVTGKTIAICIISNQMVHATCKWIHMVYPKTSLPPRCQVLTEGGFWGWLRSTHSGPCLLYCEDMREGSKTERQIEWWLENILDGSWVPRADVPVCTVSVTSFSTNPSPLQNLSGPLHSGDPEALQKAWHCAIVISAGLEGGHSVVVTSNVIEVVAGHKSLVCSLASQRISLSPSKQDGTKEPRPIDVPDWAHFVRCPLREPFLLQTLYGNRYIFLFGPWFSIDQS